MNHKNKNISPRVKTHYSITKKNSSNFMKKNKAKNKTNKCIICGNEIYTTKNQKNKALSTRYNNNYFNYNDCNYPYEKRHFKKSNNYDYTTKTQITTLPGGLKRNYYEIKDDMDFRLNTTESRLIKNINEFNSNINYIDNYEPIGQGYNVNSFPTQQRYYGSYKKGVYDHDIFNRYNFEI